MSIRPPMPCILNHCLTACLRSGLALCAAVSLFVSPLAQASLYDNDPELSSLTAEDTARYKALLSQPLDTQGSLSDLERRVQDRRNAARRLSNPDLQEQVALESMQHISRPWLYADIANIARDRGDFARAVDYHRRAVEISSAQERPFYLAHVAKDFLDANQIPQARAELADTLTAINLARRQALQPRGQRMLLRGTSFYYRLLSLVEQRTGQWNNAVEAAEQGQIAAAKALEINLPRDQEISRLLLQEDFLNALGRRFNALRVAGRLSDAETVLREAFALAATHRFSDQRKAQLYEFAGYLRFAQREFSQAEQMTRRADDLLAAMGFGPATPARSSHHRSLAFAMAGQSRWKDALAQLRQLDQSAQDTSSRLRTDFPLERGYVYLGNGLLTEALECFRRLTAENAALYGDGHFLSAQAAGLQGVALWRQGHADTREQAIGLLRRAVDQMTQPQNLGALSQSGLRPDIRHLIVATYLEALAMTDAGAAFRAVGMADWLRSGSVHEALSDAAVRAASGREGLAELVRLEQDAKHEIRSLQGILQGDSAETPRVSPTIAAQMRERISVLQAAQMQTQNRIRETFPDYDRLVRPIPPDLDGLTRQMRPDEALVVMLPDNNGVSVWAIKSDQGAPRGRFHRVNWSMERTTQAVHAIRQPLESLAATGRVQPFDTGLARSLYDALLAPVSPEIQDRSNWIFLLAGPLAQLPMGVLRSAGNDGRERWLVESVNISNIPSIASWLSIRQADKVRRSGVSFIAWGDPLFNPQKAAPAASDSNARLLISPQRRSVALDQQQTPASNPYHDIPPLPETAEELIQIASTLNADAKRNLLLGRAATRTSVLDASRQQRLRNSQIVAFATHGLIPGDLPGLEEPALAMAADGSEVSNVLGPLLKLSDVMTLDMDADWVVLSACNTASSDGRAEEALSGLARGFFYAGGRSLLVTQWAVESRSAMDITTRTFRHFREHPERGKSASLRAAMLEVMQVPQYRHPAYWAPFILVGDIVP